MWRARQGSAAPMTSSSSTRAAGPPETSAGWPAAQGGRRKAEGSRQSANGNRQAGGPINVGFLFYDLRPDDDGSTRWELYETGLDQTRVNSLGAVVTGLQNVWHAGVNAWHQRMGDLVLLASAADIVKAADGPGAPRPPRVRGGGG